MQNQASGTWDRMGLIVEALPYRQYTVRLDGSGRISLRNRKHLRPVAESTPPPTPPTLRPPTPPAAQPTTTPAQVSTPTQPQLRPAPRTQEAGDRVYCCEGVWFINMSSSGDSTPPRSGSSHSCGSRLYSSTRHKKRKNIQRFGASAREDEVASDRVSKMDARPPASQSGDVNNTTLSKFLEAWAALQEDVNKLKSDRGARASVGSEPGTSGIRSGPAQDLGGNNLEGEVYRQKVQRLSWHRGDQVC
ncbi:hypothetical protein O3P69_014855 [Scylla paramamosain]|uniref:Uncharacterized protein n=1 Tax=Scylla paramamosain TaxID=85552 RepID=A0AAW0TZU3_SCYPA